MTKASEATDPGKVIAHVRELRAQADKAEAEAIKTALGLTAGNAHHAAVLLGMPIGTLTAMLRPDRRHAALAGLMARRRGRPPVSAAGIAAAAHSMPKRIAQLMPLTKGNGKTKAKPKARPKLKALPKLPALPKAPKVAASKRTAAEWAGLAGAWLAAKARGADQATFCATHNASPSSLREHVAKLRKATAAPVAEAAS